MRPPGQVDEVQTIVTSREQVNANPECLARTLPRTRLSRNSSVIGSRLLLAEPAAGEPLRGFDVRHAQDRRARCEPLLQVSLSVRASLPRRQPRRRTRRVRARTSTTCTSPSQLPGRPWRTPNPRTGHPPAQARLPELRQLRGELPGGRLLGQRRPGATTTPGWPPASLPTRRRLLRPRLDVGLGHLRVVEPHRRRPLHGPVQRQHRQPGARGRQPVRSRDPVPRRPDRGQPDAELGVADRPRLGPHVAVHLGLRRRGDHALPRRRRHAGAGGRCASRMWCPSADPYSAVGFGAKSPYTMLRPAILD